MAKQGDPNHGHGEVFDNYPYDQDDNKPTGAASGFTTPPLPPKNSPVTKKSSGMSTKELALYFGSFLGAGVFFYFVSPAVPDEIAVQFLIAVIGLARQRYLNNK